MWVEFAPRGFPSVTPGFPSPQKPTFPNSNSIRNQVDEETLRGCATSKSLFIYLLERTPESYNVKRIFISNTVLTAFKFKVQLLALREGTFLLSVQLSAR